MINGRYVATINGIPIKAYGFGDSTNYAEFLSDGELILHGTARVYQGIEVAATDFKEPTSQSATLVNRGMGVAYEFADGSAEHIHTEIRIPAKWVDTEDITLVGIWSSPATSEDCSWEIRYLFRGIDEDMTETTPDGILQSDETSSATANGLVHSIMTIPAADFDSGDKKLLFEVWRNGGDANDTLGDTAYVHAIMVRGVSNKLGGST